MIFMYERLTFCFDNEVLCKVGYLMIESGWNEEGTSSWTLPCNEPNDLVGLKVLWLTDKPLLKCAKF